MNQTAYTINKQKTELRLEQVNQHVIPTLFDHQQAVLDRAPSVRLLAFDTGTGKTITSISLVNKLATDSRVLVVVPKTNVEQWGVELSKYLKTGMSALVISKEEFKKKVKELEPFDNIIIDEGHYFAGISSDLTKKMYWYLKKHNVKNRYICTATPYCSTPKNIYTLAKLLGHEWNYSEFVNKFFYYVDMGPRRVPMQRPDMENEIAILVKQIGDTVDIKDVVDVPEQEVFVESITLTKEQVKAIDDNFDPLFIVRWTRQHQIENGFMYENECSESEVGGKICKSFPSNKLARVIGLSEEHKKLVVVARYTAQLELFEKELTKRNKKVYLLSGATKNRQEIIDQANACDDCVFLMQASCSAGFELPTFDTMVFASLSFSYVDHKQACGRILRINNLHKNRYIHLVSDGVDRDVYSCIMKKQDFSLQIYSNN